MQTLCRVWLEVPKRESERAVRGMFEGGATSAVFKQHLIALNGEFERLVVENEELRKRCVSGNQMPSAVLSSPCSPTHVSTMSSFPGVPDGSETLWQVRSLVACSWKSKKLYETLWIASVCLEKNVTEAHTVHQPCWDMKPHRPLVEWAKIDQNISPLEGTCRVTWRCSIWFKL